MEATAPQTTPPQTGPPQTGPPQTQLSLLGKALFALACVFTLLGLLDLAGIGAADAPIRAIKDLINWTMGPVVYFVVSCVAFWAMLRFRSWTQPKFAGVLLFLTIGFVIFSLDDSNFQAIIFKPDNIPIAIMLLLVGFFTWLSLHQAFENDRRIAAGGTPEEAEDTNKRVWTWPDLVYTEFLSMIIFTVILVLWSIVIAAPLEEPANPSNTPNPSKAPWYFLGLQEMLVYFDPWMAGVVLPSLIIVGLMAIPYIDTNPKGNGYYVFNDRKWEISLYLFGFIILWVLLIILGTFLRGPNWNFFGPYEYWDVHKILALNNVDLSEIIWVRMLGTSLPDHWLPREIFGILICAAYMLVLPVLLAKTWFKRFYDKMGPPRYYVTVVFLFLPMMSLPIKMFLRWIFNLKYVVHIGEYFFNI